MLGLLISAGGGLYPAELRAHKERVNTTKATYEISIVC
jgi:hypothetical protein